MSCSDNSRITVKSFSNRLSFGWNKSRIDGSNNLEAKVSWHVQYLLIKHECRSSWQAQYLVLCWRVAPVALRIVVDVSSMDDFCCSAHCNKRSMRESMLHAHKYP